MTFELSPLYIQNFALVLTRISTVFVAAPVFGSRGIPAQVKIGLAVFATLIFLPMQTRELVAVPDGLIGLILALGREVAVGLVIAFAVLLVFIGLEMAAQVMGVQIGFGLGSVLDPVGGVPSSTLDQFYVVLVTLAFLTANGHYLVLEGIGRTFDLVPLNTFDASTLDMSGMLLLSAAMFVIAVRIAMPVTVALFLTDLTLGLVSRSFPQLNVLVVGMPLKILVGLLVLMLSLEATATVMNGAFGHILDDVAVALTGEP